MKIEKYEASPLKSACNRIHPASGVMIFNGTAQFGLAAICLSEGNLKAASLSAVFGFASLGAAALDEYIVPKIRKALQSKPDDNERYLIENNSFKILEK